MQSRIADPSRWAAIDAERERYILYMLGNDEDARRFWQEWLPEEMEYRLWVEFWRRWK